MRPLQLDFVKPGGPHRGLAAALLLVGVVALAGTLLHAARLRAEVARMTAAAQDSERAARQGRQALGPVSAAADEATRQELAQARLVAAALGLDWASLFSRLEGQRVAGVTLLAVQREAGSTKRLRLTGEARRLDEALAYVSQLSGAPGFSNVHLVSHETVGQGERPAVQFALLVDWGAQP